MPQPITRRASWLVGWAGHFFPSIEKPRLEAQGQELLDFFVHRPSADFGLKGFF